MVFCLFLVVPKIIIYIFLQCHGDSVISIPANLSYKEADQFYKLSLKKLTRENDSFHRLIFIWKLCSKGIPFWSKELLEGIRIFIILAPLRQD